MAKKIRVCNGPRCRQNGCKNLMEVIKLSNITADLDYCSCTGNCETAPNVTEDDKFVYRAAKTHDIVEKIKKGQHEILVPTDINIDNFDELI